MHTRGLFLIGVYQGSAPVIRGDGSAVPGLSKVGVVVSAEGVDPYVRDASFNTVDRDTGEATAIASKLAKAPPVIGSSLAVKVKPNISKGGYINFEALDFAPVTDLPPSK